MGKSEDHIAAHKANQGKPKPDYMLGTDVGMYHVRAVKQAYTKIIKSICPRAMLFYFLIIRQDKQRFIGLPFRIQQPSVFDVQLFQL